jgi:leucyl aminopeptidase
MKIKHARKVQLQGMEALVLPLFKRFDPEEVGRVCPELPPLLKKRKFKGRVGDRLTFYSVGLGTFCAAVGGGDPRSLLDTRKCASHIMGILGENKVSRAVIRFGPATDLNTEAAVNFVDYLYLNHYRFDSYLSKDARAGRVKKIILVFEGAKPLGAGTLAEREILDVSVRRVRRLVDEIPARLNPDTLCREFEENAADTGVGIDVRRGKELEDMRLKGLVTVGQGSVYEPALIRLTYTPPSHRWTVAVVGKGITFDSGGLNIKIGNYMEEMKCDMAGAATVLGIVDAAARLQLPVKVEAFAAVAENMPGHRAYKPGDIITYKNGKSVEVVNTDAEGRLVLADALIEAAALKPNYIIEFSTLTGAIVTALGDTFAGLMTTHTGLRRHLERAGETTGDLVWPMPMFADYRESIKSKVADLKNANYKGASSIKAGLFLKEFTAGIPFAHIDIAGTAFLSSTNSFYSQQGATGFGVRLMVDFLKQLSENGR